MRRAFRFAGAPGSVTVPSPEPGTRRPRATGSCPGRQWSRSSSPSRVPSRDPQAGDQQDRSRGGRQPARKRPAGVPGGGVVLGAHGDRSSRVSRASSSGGRSASFGVDPTRAPGQAHSSSPIVLLPLHVRQPRHRDAERQRIARFARLNRAEACWRVEDLRDRVVSNCSTPTAGITSRSPGGSAARAATVPGRRPAPAPTPGVNRGRSRLARHPSLAAYGPLGVGQAAARRGVRVGNGSSGTSPAGATTPAVSRDACATTGDRGMRRASAAAHGFGDRARDPPKRSSSSGVPSSPVIPRGCPALVTAVADHATSLVSRSCCWDVTRIREALGPLAPAVLDRDAQGLRIVPGSVGSPGTADGGGA